MASDNITLAQIPPGPILKYYGDIASQAITPEDVREEALTFEATIAADGTVVAQTPKITIVSRYSFALKRVYAEIMGVPETDPAAGLTRFNIFEEGRNFTVFKQPVSLGAPLQTHNPYYWDGVYISVPGTDWSVQWSVNATLWQAYVGATRRVSVTTVGDYIACNPTQR